MYPPKGRVKGSQQQIADCYDGLRFNKDRQAAFPGADPPQGTGYVAALRPVLLLVSLGFDAISDPSLNLNQELTLLPEICTSALVCKGPLYGVENMQCFLWSLQITLGMAAS